MRILLYRHNMPRARLNLIRLFYRERDHTLSRNALTVMFVRTVLVTCLPKPINKK